MKRLAEMVVLVTPRSFGIEDPSLREALESAVGEVRYNERGRPLRADELRSDIDGVDGMIAGLDEIDASVLSQASQLRVIARYGVGTNNVDLEAATRQGIMVTNTPSANTDAVAELTIGLFFALARSIPQINEAVHDGEWPTRRGIEVAGRTVAILGFGKIGQTVARHAQALGCTVVAHDPYADEATAEELKIRLDSLDAVLDVADFLSLHLPVTPETSGMVDYSLLQRMKPGGYLVNTARGELVVEEDLIRSLDDGLLRGAAFDSLREEPPPAGHPFLERSDIILTPHMGAHTVEAAAAMGRDALADLLAVLSGRSPRFPVIPRGGGSTS
jgi:D-3-phosphoglycerate dehydrogenase / 2-oxoglutarate reductase